jgi:hypothetical protein
MAMVSEVELYNESLGTTITFKESSFDYILESCDLGTIEGVRNEQNLVGQDGILVADILYGTRTVTLVCWLVGRDDSIISAYRRGLNRFINPKQKLRIKQNGYTISGYPLHTVSYGTDVKVMNECMCRCMIEVLCDDPLFKDALDTNVGVALWENKLVFPLVFEGTPEVLIFGARSESQIVQATNSGDVPCGMLVTFEASGSVTSPKLINVSTQEYIQVGVTLATGEKVTIDTRSRVPVVSKYSTEGVLTNIINLVTDASTFLKLPLGLSNFSYTAAANSENLEVKITYANKYLEVI